MLRSFVIHTGLILLFVFLQAFLFHNMQLSSLYLQPFVYVLAIMLLPIEFPKWLVLLLAFFSGLLLDIFNDSLGINAAALTFMAFLRPVFFNVIAPYNGYESGTLPRIGYYSFAWILKYTVLSVVSFSIAYYFLVSFSFDYFFTDLLKIVFGSLYSIVIILLFHFAFFRK